MSRYINGKDKYIEVKTTKLSKELLNISPVTIRWKKLETEYDICRC